MSEEAVVISEAAPELQAKASEMGWIPPDRYKGDPERFVDAEEFIRRGETFLPIVKKRAEQLEAKIGGLAAQNQSLAEQLKQTKAALDEIEERHSVETARAIAEATQSLKARLAKASAAGDHEAVADLTEKLVEVKAAAEEHETAKADAKAAAATVTSTTGEAFVMPPELKQWIEEDASWFGTDKRKTSLAMGIAQDLRDKGETAKGRDFFNKVSAELKAMLGEGGRSEPAPGKVEASRGGSGGGSGNGAGHKGYADLPADAKASCDADAKRFVGPGKKYPDVAAWRAKYAEIYFR